MESWYVKRKMADLMEYSPILYLKVQKLRHHKKPAVVERMAASDTDITIEGYPRCANSFAVRAFLFANQNSGKMKIATHLHSPAHVISSVRMKIPTLILIRHPDSAVVSRLAHIIQFNGLPSLQKGRGISEKEKKRLTRYWTLRYAAFYNAIVPYADDFVIAEFNEATSDFSKIIYRINANFNTSFRPFRHTEQNVQAIFSSSKVHLYPSQERERIKSLFKDGYFSRSNRHCREVAVKQYQNFLNLRDNHQ